MSNALAVDALLHLVRVMEAAETAERVHQEACDADSTATGSRHGHGEQARADVAAAREHVMSWLDDIGRARADVLWQLGQGEADWSSWLAKHTSLQGLPRASGAD